MKKQSTLFLTLLLLTLAILLNVWSIKAQKTSTNNQETIIKYLSGTGKDHTATWDFFCTKGRKSGAWSKIEVPSCWEQQGFGSYNYGHDPMDERADEEGLYKHQFELPDSWRNKTVRIVFEAAMTDTEVKINGELAGAIHQGAFYEFKYDITDKLEFGKPNLLEVKVSKVSANQSINFAERQADFWIFGGIFRPVYLEILPEEHIERIAIDAKANGNILADIFTKTSEGTVQLALLDLNGNKLRDLALSKAKYEDGKLHVETKANNIKTWNPEYPRLYQLQVSLLDENGRVTHKIKERIGFRTVEVLEGDGIYVNGQKIKFKGVNRHSFYPSSGRTTSKALSIAHIKMMKDMNMNAVRMSHYPPDKHFLEACDSLGLFVIDEVCTWHSPHLDTEVGRKIVEETVTRDVNHPSILLWSNGNETGWNTELDDDYAIWDIQQREVIHPWNIFRKTNTLHYFHYHGLANDAPKKDKIFFPTEFLHGLYDGGHGAGLEDYWEKMWDMPLSAGGFLWDFADEAIERTDRNNQLDTDGNHAADGIVGPYGEKEASYFAIKEIWSPVYIYDRFIRPNFNGVFKVENRFHFTSLSECSLIASWMKFDAPSITKQGTFLFKEAVKLPSLAPEEVGTFTVNKPSNWQQADVLYLTAFDPYGKEIFTWSYPVQKPKTLNEKLIKHFSNGAVTSEETNGEIIVSANGLTYAFSKDSGVLNKVEKNGQLIPLSNGPIILDQNAIIEQLNLIPSENKLEVEFIYELKEKTPEWSKHKEYSSDFIKWTIHSDGILDLHVEFKNKKRIKKFKGISFDYPEEEVAGMKWLGDGPYRVWRNRTKGTRFQVWENDYNNTITGESGFVYPEFKGFFSSLYWAKIRGKSKQGFTVYCHTPHIYLRMLTPQNPSEDPNNLVSPAFPKGDISFLMNIPPIGTKFQKSDSTGPHGNTENYFGNDDEPIVIELTFEF